MPQGAMLLEPVAVDPLVAADSDGRPEAEVEAHKRDGVGGPCTGGLGRGWKRWSPPSPDPRHPKIAAMMNPYLELSNGILSLPSILSAGKIRMEDLPGLDKYKDPTTGCNTMCWAEVLGPCHFPD